MTTHLSFPRVLLIGLRLILLGEALIGAASAKELGSDSNTLLLLHFNNSLKGVAGEMPSQSPGVSFTPGLFGAGVLIDSHDQLAYSTSGNFNRTTGTVEFWLKPRWDGNDYSYHKLFILGVVWEPTLVITKDSANNLRFIIGHDDSEAYQAINVGHWAANEWHHIAITWAVPGQMKTYLDGFESISHPALNQDLINSLPPTLSLGVRDESDQATAVYDELRISSVARTAAEIGQSFSAGLSISRLTIAPDPVQVRAGLTAPPELTGLTNLADVTRIPGPAADWTSKNPGIAAVDSNGRIAGVSAGQTIVTATIQGVSDQVTVIVLAALTDLEVMYIERNPKYPRYDALYAQTYVTDDWLGYSIDVPNGLGSGQTSATKRWPDNGETVTYTAHILNHGQTPRSGFAYKWFVDGVEAGGGISTTPLAPYETAVVDLQLVWDNKRHSVKCLIESDDDRPTNNSVEDFTDAVALCTCIERGHDAKFTNKTPDFPSAATSSEIEWFQRHAQRLNTMFRDAGTPIRVRYDRLEVIPDGATAFPGGTNERLLCDGIFPEVFRAHEETYRTISAYYRAAEDIDFGLLHELGHQLGLIDLYRLNMSPDMNHVNGQAYVTVDDLMMNVSPFFSIHSALAMARWHGFKRGYFGTYLYNIPAQNYLRILAANGNPLPYAEVTIYQKLPGWDRESIEPTPKFLGATGAAGIYALPNVNIDLSRFVATAIGEIPAPNPFGYISNHGDNGVFLIQIKKNEVTDYQWIDITRFNIAYWEGNTTKATYDIPTLIPAVSVLPAVIDVGADIAENRINLRSNALIEVAILTTQLDRGEPVDFDATAVDPQTVRFGPANARPLVEGNTAQDVDNDGDKDLLLVFRFVTTGIRCGDTSMALSAKTFAGQAIEGVDAVSTVGCEDRRRISGRE